MKTSLLTTALYLSTLLFIPSMSFAVQPTAEDLKLEKHRLQYKAYIPAQYLLFDVVEGDLNQDGQKDLVLMLKATDPKQSIVNRYDKKVDRNRRGVLVLLAEGKGKYKELLKNLSAFSSENEDGGVYFPPDLSLDIQNNKFYVHYGHGRYGYWTYSFRLEGKDLRLIGYDSSSNHGPYIKSETSINFLTGKKVVRNNINKETEDDPKFKEAWTQFKSPKLYLSKIKDFDQLDF